jgi:hypothetical protein
MTEQTPPTGEPTETPTEDVGSGADEGATPPPPPTATTLSDEPSRPPEKKSRRGMVIGLVAGLVVIVLVAGALTAFLVTRGPEKHSITVTSTAGGMKRDKSKEADLKQEIDATAAQFKAQFKGTAVKTGLYNQDSTSKGPKGQMLFVGFTFDKPSDKHPADIVKQLRTAATANKLTVTDVPTGDAGGKAVCLASPSDAAQKTASCVWATRDSGGGLFPSVPGYDAKQMAKLMTDVRSDVEQTE